MVRKTSEVGPYIVGLAHKYPPHRLAPVDFENIVRTLYPNFAENPGLQRLVQFNRKTQIKSRQIAVDITKWTKDDVVPPTVTELSRSYRDLGVELAASACREALQESSLSAKDITHTVAVTCTDQGNPGYDLYICRTLGLSHNVQRVLLHGVGCAGGLSALRTAADIAACESQRGRAARVLVVACELCSLFFRAELKSASEDEALHIAPALFGDGAAAVVVCNALALESRKPVYELQDWGSMMLPNTAELMSYEITGNGMLATINKDVGKAAVGAIKPMFQRIHRKSSKNADHSETSPPTFQDFDWAIHPGGAAILQGAQHTLGLSDEHIRASLDVYRSYGNSSSVSILIVLDKLRRMGKGRDNVIATSFGPGMMIEMFRMRRCRDIEPLPTHVSVLSRVSKRWASLQSRMIQIVGRPKGMHELPRVDSLVK